MVRCEGGESERTTKLPTQTQKRRERHSENVEWKVVRECNAMLELSHRDEIPRKDDIKSDVNDADNR